MAHQLETDLVGLLAPHHARHHHEGHKLIVAALNSRADLQVAGTELHVMLAPQSSAHRSKALAELCALLDATHTKFPGTSLRIRYGVQEVNRDS